MQKLYTSDATTHFASLLCNVHFSQFSSDQVFFIFFSWHSGENMGTQKHEVIWSFGIKMLVQMICPPPLTRCPTGPVTVHNAGCRTQQGCYRHHSGPWLNIKMSSYQYTKSHYGDKTVVRSSYLHNEVSYTGKMASLYWTNPQMAREQ